MNPAQYDDKTRQLIETFLEKQRTQQTDAAWKALSKLHAHARTAADNALNGFISYQYAYLHCYGGGDHTKVRKYLTEAVRFLLRSNDQEMLARCYNFIATDAHDSGVFDIAYNYYLTALRYDTNKEFLHNTALVEVNLGRLFSSLGDYVTARRHMRRGIRYMQEDKNRPLYLRNLIAMYLNDAFISLSLEDLAEAKRTLQKIMGLTDKSDPQEIVDIRLTLLFLRVRIALLEKDSAQAKKLLEETLTALKYTPLLYQYADDIFDFCETLMLAKRYAAIGEIIRLVHPTIMSQGAPRLRLRFSALRVSFFMLRKEEALLREALFEQQRLYEEQRKAQAQVLDYYKELIGMVGELHAEQSAVSREHLLLQIEASTDTLTGMPNRHAMIRKLESAFETAYHRKQSLGVEILDIDAFKQYNDTYGHQAGDICLSRLAWSLMRLSAHPHIFCARYGGDEFVIIYENMSDDEILTHAAKLRQEVEAQRIPHAESNVSRFVTISQGICNGVPKNKNRLWDFLSEADFALYSIKKSTLPASRGNAIRLNVQPVHGKRSQRFTSPAFSSALSSGLS